ncbi:MAG TPA: hypothetical protein VM925_14635 [Labilithrix sp.]|nr:hypothetical protein [Labilithrix sp.]
MSGGLDLLRSRVTLRDRSVADVMDLALRFVVVHGRAYALVALGSLVPVAALSLLAGWKLGWGVSWAISIPLAIVAEIPFTVLASRLVFQERVRARDVLRAAAVEVPRILFGRLLSAVLIAFGFFALLIPSFFLAAISLFAGEVMLLERASMVQAFGRSQRIAWSAMSDVVLALIVLGLVPVASVFITDIAGRSLIGEVLQFRPPPPVWNDYGSALAMLGLFVQVPYLTTARFLLYLNIRTREEGWDIQTRFAAIAAHAHDEAENTKAA